MLYDEKAQLAREAVEEKVKIKRGKKLKQRGVTDWDAYVKGKEDAETVKLDAKALPAPVPESSAPQSKAAGVHAGARSKQSSGGKPGSCAKRSVGGKEQADPGLQSKNVLSGRPTGCSGLPAGRGGPVLGNVENTVSGSTSAAK